jgi:hypothetical protein
VEDSVFVLHERAEGVMANITGGCLCGRVSYTITGEALQTGLCHCRDCQRYTGSAFEPYVVFPKASVEVRGELRTFDMAGGSGQIIHRRFCPHCGSGVMNEAEARPGNIIVLAGSLDDSTVFSPAMEVNCISAQPWVDARNDRRRFPGMPSY